MSVWLGNRNSELRCSDENLQVREITFREATCKEELHSCPVVQVAQLHSYTAKALLNRNKKICMGKNDDYFQVIWRRLVSFTLRSNGNVYW
jgi:hypothetical protein